MKQVLLKQGQAIVDDVPVPQLEPGTVLVGVDHSCISIGTEISGLGMSGEPLWKRALKQPENVKKVINMVTTTGLSRTYSLVKGQLDAGNATGYSAAGTIIALGEGVSHLQPGDRVACAGAQCAHHAEVICVPANLTALLPSDLNFAEASTVTLGAIALQGVRRASPTLGEYFVVIGLGILGQLTVQLLKANGCRVMGVDLDESRIEMAKTLGMDFGLFPDNGEIVDQVMQLTDGFGADGVIVTAATPSNEVMSTAFRSCRKKGRVVLVGDVGLDLKRGDFYQKELDFFISSSYGPGRYDPQYEEKGLDYPIGYVRWTENRNMAEYLRLLAEGRINIKPLTGTVFPIDKAPEAYQQLKTGHDKPLMTLLHYPSTGEPIERKKVLNPLASPKKGKQISLALVGAGGFAKGMHLPNLAKLTSFFDLRAIVSRKGHNAVATAKQFSANYASTDYQEALDDPLVDAVLLSTRHHLHSQMTLQALEAGKHVLVEKPLALTRSELEAITTFYETQKKEEAPLLLTGFNRRFSPIMQQLEQTLRLRTNPMILNYRMNAGYIPLDHWVHGAEGGGRNLGEACHIYDLFTFLIGSPVLSVTAKSIKPSTRYYTSNDNFIVNLSFADGSLAHLTYTALGAKDHPKEQLEAFVDGKVYVMQDYKSLHVLGAKGRTIKHATQEKGQKEELIAFAEAILHKGSWPIPLWQQIQATQISFMVEEQLTSSVSPVTVPTTDRREG